MQQLNDMVAIRMGLYFPLERQVDLERGVTSAAKEFGYSDTESCIRWLVSSPLTQKQVEVLASHLTIGETYFFRDSATFQALEEHILPELIRQRRGKSQQFRIWSAACATGEEPYSVAILLQKLIVNLDGWNISILATDINPQAIKKARLGIYDNWSFRECPLPVKDKYFRRHNNGQFEISPDIKPMVTFGYHNLAIDPYPSLASNTNAMDIILCRNVLMYFNRDTADLALSNFSKCLVEGGWLMVSPCDIPQGSNPGLRYASHSGTILYRKDGQFSYETQAAFPGEITFFPPLENSPVTSKQSFLQGQKDTTTINRPPEILEPLAVWNKTNKTQELPQSPYQQAMALFTQGAYAQAENVISSVPADKVDAGMMILLARICANQGKLEEALRNCQKSIELDKSNPNSRYMLANIMQELGRIPEAVTALTQTLYLDPGFVLAYFAMGNIALRQGDARKSTKYFENVLSILSTRTQDDVLLGDGDISTGRLAEIIRSTISVEKTK
jgi:chemotaxis protein methyltransferase CheR